MSNLLKYIKNYGNKNFYECDYNEIDNIIFASLSYLDFNGIISETKKITTIGKAGNIFLKKYKFKEVAKYGMAQKDSYKILKEIVNTKRYKDVLVYGYKYVGDKDKQFCAMTFKVKNKFIYVSFEGTDHLLSGWKEDFELCYTFPIASQDYAIKYLNNIIGLFDTNIYVGGHSKGGNLALVAAMFCNPLIRFKIKKIYNNDGPGLRKKEIESDNYKKIENKLVHIIPDYSLVGLLLRHNDNYKVVKSSRKDIMAHSVLTWQIEDNHLKEANLSNLSKKLDKSVILWLDKHDDKQREKIITTVFNALENSGLYNLYDLKNLKIAIKVIKNLNNIDSDTKKLILDFFEFNLSYLLNNFEATIEM
jgi:hypothetical protein